MQAAGNNSEQTFCIDALISGDQTDGAFKDTDLSDEGCGHIRGYIFFQLERDSASNHNKTPLIENSSL